MNFENKRERMLGYATIKNQDDIVDIRNLMAEGNYPLSMTDCEVVGISGNCGPDCPVLLRGDCENEDEEPENHNGNQLTTKDMAEVIAEGIINPYEELLGTEREKRLKSKKGE